MCCKREITISASDIRIGDSIYYYSDYYCIVTEIVKTDNFVQITLSSAEKNTGICCVVITKKYSLNTPVKIYRNFWFC